MDLRLKQWKQRQEHQQQQQLQEESEDQHHQQSPAKLPKLLHQHHPQHPHNNDGNNSSNHNINDRPLPPSGSTLPLFVPDHHQQCTKQPALSPFPDLAPSASNNRSSPRMGSYFSLAQWQELELQALIYRYMLSGAAVPPELLQPIKKSIVQSPFLLHHHPVAHFQHYPQFQPAWYWGRAVMDPEPGRCRRTDGKKWRCSRDVVPGQKYCERHMHRGRNRSRKPVEIPTSSTCAAVAAATGSVLVDGGNLKTNANPAAPAAIGAVTGRSHFSVSGSSPPPIDLFQVNKSFSRLKPQYKSQNEAHPRSDSHVLRHFFDDWPRSLQKPDGSADGAGPVNSASTGLSMSLARNSSSDVSLKLSTGDGEFIGGAVDRNGERDQMQVGNWSTGWLPNRVASVGGPLAEALRSSTTTSHSSPTSVLHRLPCALASETSLVT